ncbi:MAG: S8 family serine peptidase [Candidatus Cloacimonetes bacterium]|nr:S8 family serine peptidase [Candidatus Cloacimonadota bacterium]
MLQLLVTFFAITNGIYAYNQISPSVQELIDNRPTVIKTFLIHFKPVYRKQHKGKKHRIKESSTDILIRHKQHVRASQASFENDHLLLLQDYKMHSLWVSNSMRITCPAEFIEEIHKRNDIRYIQMDSEVFLPRLAHKRLLEPHEISEISEGLKHLRISKLRNSSYFNMTGKNSKIGLIDTGFDPTLFNEEQITSKDFTSQYDGKSPSIEHATNSLGILIGSKNNKVKTAITPDAHIYHAKVFHHNNTSRISTILTAMQWLLDPDDDPSTDDFPKVISNSWATLTLNKELMLPFWEALSTMKKLGVIPIFPSGNSGQSQKISLSAGLPHAISIGSISNNGSPSTFSTKAEVEWEGITYQKPELFAPGENIISVLPDGQYAEISSTSCSSNYVAAIIALIQEANPKLGPKHIKKILLQTTHRLADGKKTHIVDAYQAIDLAVHGGVVKGLIDGPESSTKISVQPGDLTFVSKTTGAFNFFLKEGTYQLTFNSQGFRTYTEEITIRKQKKHSLMIDLQNSQEHEVSINIVDSQDTKINGVLKLYDDQDKQFLIDDGTLSVTLFEGLYRGQIEVSGLKDQPFLLNVDRMHDQIDYRVSSIPAILIVKDAKENDQMSKVENSLQSLNIAYDMINHTIASDDILAYDLVFWLTEQESFDTLSSIEQNTLRDYISTGGRVVFSGENLAYHLRFSSFLKESCGVDFSKDSSAVKSILFSQSKSTLADNPSFYYPDTLTPSASNSENFLFYTSGETAGVYKKDQQGGATLFLGFSINQINNQESRNELINQVLEKIQPKLQDQIQRIQNLFQKHKKAYHQIVNRFNNETIHNKQEIKEHLRNFSSKRGLQPVLEYIFYQDTDPSLHENLY